jgi:hypothetical protein
MLIDILISLAIFVVLLPVMHIIFMDEHGEVMKRPLLRAPELPTSFSLKRKVATAQPEGFPPTRAASNRPDDVRAHYREVSRYLMERWEQNMEEATEAHTLRLMVTEAKNRLAIAEAAFNNTNADPYSYTPSSEARKKWLETRTEYNRLRVNAEAAWCDRMQLPRGTKMHEYKYTPTWSLTSASNPAMMITG